MQPINRGYRGREKVLAVSQMFQLKTPLVKATSQR